MVFTVTDLDFRVGRELTVTGRIRNNCKEFSINVGHSSDYLAFHFNPRFDHVGDVRTIVCNSKNGDWIEGGEQRDRHFPFQTGQDFTVGITFNHETFYAKLQDGHMVTFPNRFRQELYNHLHVYGDVWVNNIKIN